MNRAARNLPMWNGTTQFILEGQDLVLNLRLLELVQAQVQAKCGSSKLTRCAPLASAPQRGSTRACRKIAAMRSAFR